MDHSDASVIVQSFQYIDQFTLLASLAIKNCTAPAFTLTACAIVNQAVVGYSQHPKETLLVFCKFIAVDEI